MSQEIHPNLPETSDGLLPERQTSSHRLGLKLLAGGLAVAATATGAYLYVSRDKQPCETSVAISNESSSTTTVINMPGGDQLYMSVFTQPGESGQATPRVEVSVGTNLFGNNSAVIDDIGTPGPEASFAVAPNRTLLVDVSQDAVTTSCASSER